MKVALVTGGATGIGAACCRALSQAGLAVGIHHRTSAAAAQALQEELGENTFLVSADLSTTEGVDAVYEVMRQRGGLEVLVNNAGATADAPLFSARLEDFDRVVATNMRSTWYLTKRLARLMMRQRSGRIINISSVVGSTGNPGQSVYGMTKAAIDNFTRTAAAELADYGILVNAVAPGFIETAMTQVLPEEIREGILARVPLKRMGTPQEVAAMVRFLALEATYCTGTTFHVNGGMYGG
ncbi:MAG: SDR family oxidoreductase [Candidatus Xenobium sp.]|nr:SDR family oxidoreductase [Burkholderiales bacterium]